MANKDPQMTSDLPESKVQTWMTKHLPKIMAACEDGSVESTDERLEGIGEGSTASLQ